MRRILTWAQSALMRERSVGMFDQALFSSATLLQTYLYSRFLPSEDFAVFGLIQGCCLVALGLQRSAIILPMIVTTRNRKVDSSWAEADIKLQLGAAVMAIVLSFVLSSQSLTTALRLGSVSIIAVLAYEFERRLHFSQHDRTSVLIGASGYFALTVGSVALVCSFFPHAKGAAAGLIAAAGLMAAISRIRRGTLGPAAEKVSKHFSIIKWNLLSFLPFAIYNNAFVLLIGASTGPASVALFVASRLVTAPTQTLIQAVDSVDKPRARQAFFDSEVPGLLGSLGRTRKSLLTVGVPYLIATMLLADFISELFFPSVRGDMPAAIRIWCVVALAMLMGQPSETGLLTLGKSNVLFVSRCAAALTTLALLFGTPPAFEGIAPYLAIAGGWGVSAIFAGAMLRHYTQAKTEGPHE